MLAKRIIPTLLYRGEQLVKGERFDSWRSVGHIQQAARIYAARGVDELCILDIGATPEGRGPDLDLVARIAEGNFTPLTVGGGVRTVDDVGALLRAGADKVAIGTGAFGRGSFLQEVTQKFGSQAVMVSIDVKGGCIATHCGRNVWRANVESSVAIVTQAICAGKNGAGEILLTSIDREGTMQGYDLDLIHAVSEAVSIPVIAHGGAGSYEHMLQAIAAGADAVAAGALFQFTDATPRGAAEYLQERGVEVRL